MSNVFADFCDLGQTGNMIGSRWVIYVLNTYNVIGYHAQRTTTGGYTVGVRRAGGDARHVDAVNYGRQVVCLVAGWSFYALITYITGKQMQHTAAGG